MAGALENAAKLLEESPYKKCLAVEFRYSRFDGGKGKEFEEGELLGRCCSLWRS